MATAEMLQNPRTTRTSGPGKFVRGLCVGLGSVLERSPLWSSYSISFAFHFLLILALACLGLNTEPRSQAHWLTIAAGLADETPTAFVTGAAKAEIARIPENGTGTGHPYPGASPIFQAGASDAAKLVEVSLPDATASVPGDASPTPGWIASDPVSVASGTPIPAGDNLAKAEASGDNSTGATGLNLMLPVGKMATGGGLEGRGKAARAGLVKGRGGSSESEDAVGRGLAWLAAHQRADGSWRFNHQEGPCRGLCADPGTAGSTTAATGLALLTFLGAGETEKDSPYKAVVEKGLYYLTTRLVLTPHGGDLQEGTMYGQGIAAIALCEAYAMTGDESLQFPAQKAIDFICNAQHAGGGWRYAPGQPGDTTVFGWQLMALKSARLAGLNVPRSHFYLCEKFLDSVQSEKGAGYGYMKTGKQPSPTAVGLLMRMYMGWGHDDPRLARGVEYLQKLGPAPNAMYFNFYASQVLHHYGGDGWNKWNQKLRERLIATQSRHGHEHGSWYFQDQHGQAGGRLYTTAMCLLTLEVYYRYMPLYGERPVEEEF